MAKKASSKPGAEEQSFSLRLTQRQREAMIHATRLRRKIKDRLKTLPEGSQVAHFSRGELDHIVEEVDTAAAFAPDPYRERLAAVQRKVGDLLLSASEEPETQPRRPPGPSDLILQFRITLLDIEPPVWRRIQIQNGTLAELHKLIQAAMGWWNYHLHFFEIDGLKYGPLTDDELGLEVEDESAVRLADLVPTGKRARWYYTYDLGDDWRHEILFEGFPPKEKRQRYPVCLEGERACPPEDVGGPWGYTEYLEITANSNHERHQELVEWRGPFDPGAFDPQRATKEMRRIR